MHSLLSLPLEFSPGSVSLECFLDSQFKPLCIITSGTIFSSTSNYKLLTPAKLQPSFLPSNTQPYTSHWNAVPFMDLHHRTQLVRPGSKSLTYHKFGFRTSAGVYHICPWLEYHSRSIWPGVVFSCD
ncbi:uncharacterized protein LOC118557889 isoform X2 [Fundulus heteroclitus]|uniref:uncharacterized protein LOC118557889 isoform X2 n=1 Tax=Fundulus heteroclitus TaxID=8078 RepID=UPI00165ADE17|nr:uncharacterized protein LOC118557889 isoform X2 [Fundulus heteroclitus]